MEKIAYDFKNRTAIVTGGAQGFGLDITKRFLKSGANFPWNGASQLEPEQDIENEVYSQGSGAPVKCSSGNNPYFRCKCTDW